MLRFVILLIAFFILSGCESTSSSHLPRGANAYKTFAPVDASISEQDYRVGPLDVLSINVFQEEELSFEKLSVDASGNLLLPLIGNVQAGGKSAAQIAAEIAARLGERYLRNPQVSVTVVSSMSQKITVEGQVTEPGVYDINSSTTLLEALARAKSPTRIAKLNEVVVFRFVDGKRTGALFDVKKIRSGEMPDPRLVGGDVVVVGFSAIKGGFRDFLTAAPFLSVFRIF